MNFHCERCNATLEAADTDAGQVMDCPRCQQAITVPEPIRVNGPALRAQLQRAAAQNHIATPMPSAHTGPIEITNVSIPFASVLALVLKITAASLLVGIPLGLLFSLLSFLAGCLK
jgi:hypothetical protein